MHLLHPIAETMQELVWRTRGVLLFMLRAYVYVLSREILIVLSTAHKQDSYAEQLPVAFAV